MYGHLSGCLSSPAADAEATFAGIMFITGGDVAAVMPASLG